MKLENDLLKNLQREEKQILVVKYKSAPFALVNEDDLDIWADALILKINAITGWVSPSGMSLTVFTDQLKKKIKETYFSCNPDEIEFAFRQFGMNVKDWGKQMNLALIDEVMAPYLAKRSELSKIEEQEKLKKMLPAPPVISDEELWNQTMFMVRNGRYTIEIIPPGMYEWADRNGNIDLKPEQKMEYVEKAKLVRHSNVAKDYEKNPHSVVTKKMLADFNQMIADKLFTQEEKDKITDIAKKMIVFDMMKKTDQ